VPLPCVIITRSLVAVESPVEDVLLRMWIRTLKSARGLSSEDRAHRCWGVSLVVRSGLSELVVPHGRDIV
jgi:hypothetical protein